MSRRETYGRAEVQTAQLLVELQKDPALHVEAIVLNKGMLYDQLVLAGINTHLIDEGALNSFEISRRLYEFNRRWRPDVVHTHRIKENCLGGLLPHCQTSGDSAHSSWHPRGA